VRHRNGIRKLSRPTDQRLALMRSIVRALFLHGKIKVTLVRAKAARVVAEKLITAAKGNDLHARRKVESILADRKLVSLVFKTIPERFEGRSGGYTRITRIGNRVGDAAPLAVLELI